MSRTRSATSSPPPARPGKRGPYAKSSETRERILAAAFEVAGEEGIVGASVARIAERAGVSVGNVHYHFGSRGELLHEVMQWVVDEHERELYRHVDGIEGYFEREEASIRTYLAFLRRHPAWIRLSEESRLHAPELYERGLQTWIAMLTQNLEVGIARGELCAMTPDEIDAQAHLLLGARYFLDRMLVPPHGGSGHDDEHIVATYLALVRGGLRKERS